MPVQGPRIVALAISASLCLPACSSGPSKEEYIAQADEICAEAGAAGEALGIPKNEKEFDETVEEATQITLEAIAQLRALEPPEDDREVIETIYNNMEEAVAYIPQIQEASDRGDAEAMGELNQQLTHAAMVAEELARRYGFKECGVSQNLVE